MAVWNTLVLGFVFGLAAAVPIGPVNIELVRRSLTRGWADAVALGFGAVSVDVVYACLAVTLTGVGGKGGVAESPWVFWTLAPASVLLLGYLGSLSLQGAWRALHGQGLLARAASSNPRNPASTLARTYLTGLAMTAVNPMTLVFWFVTLPAQALTRGVEGGQLGFLAAGVFLGTAAWVLGFTTLLSALGRWRRPWWEVAAEATGGLLLLGFAALGLAAMAARLMGS